jgi:hypothetical protein
MGPDALLARMLGSVDRVTYLRRSGIGRPIAVLTAHGVDLELVFPNPVLLTGVNLYLGSEARRLTEDPYGSGWLFEGTEALDHPVTAGLISGGDVPAWMDREIGRISGFLAGGMHDGGVFAPDVLSQLSRDEMKRLFQEFFWELRAW